MNLPKRFLLLVLVAVVAAGGIATVAIAGGGDSDDEKNEPATTTAAALRAVATAEREAGGTAIDVDADDDTRAWEVTTSQGTTVLVDLDGDAVQRELGATDDPEDVALAADARVSLPEAVDAAGADGELTSAGIDRDDDVTDAPVVWSLSFATSGTTETEVDVDARTGEVVSRVDDRD